MLWLWKGASAHWNLRESMIFELLPDGASLPRLQPKQFCNFESSIALQRGCLVNLGLYADFCLSFLLWVLMLHQKVLQLYTGSEGEILIIGEDIKFFLILLTFLLLSFFLCNLVWPMCRWPFCTFWIARHFFRIFFTITWTVVGLSGSSSHDSFHSIGTWYLLLVNLFSVVNFFRPFTSLMDIVVSWLSTFMHSPYSRNCWYCCESSHHCELCLFCWHCRYILSVYYLL